MQAACGPYETELADFPVFVGDVVSGVRAGLRYARLRTNAALVRRSPRSPDLHDDQHCVLISQSSGRACITHAGVSHHLAPGDLMLMDSVGACEIEPQGLIEHIAISLPRAEVARQVGRVGLIQGRIASDSTSGRLLGLLVNQLPQEIDSQSTSQDQGVLLAVLSLLGSAINTTPLLSSHDVKSCRNLRQQADEIIKLSLTRPDLTPVSVASALGVSLRKLYRAFESTGDSVYRYILFQRLHASAGELVSADRNHQSITEIAYRWGFTDSAHFSRTFKKLHGVSPREFRNARINSFSILNQTQLASDAET
ncbi:Transcriptional activator FeaR [compost metagenome]